MRRDPALDPDLAPSFQTEGPRALDYGTDHRSRRIRPTHVMVTLVLVACVAGSWMLGRSARAQAQTLLYIRQASTHVQQDTTVVFEGDAEAAGALIAAGTHHAVDSTGQAAAINDPESLQVFRDAVDAEAFDAAGALVFLHELTTPSGLRRIVAVHYLPQYVNGHLNPRAGLIAHVFEPGGFFGRPRLIGESHSKLLVSADLDRDLVPEGDAAIDLHADLDLENLPELPAPGVIRSDLDHMGLTSQALRQAFDPWGRTATARWYAGQPDQDDLAHFTIEFELDGRPGTIDGFLADDGRHVRMQARPADGMVRDRFNYGMQIGMPRGF